MSISPPVIPPVAAGLIKAESGLLLADAAALVSGESAGELRSLFAGREGEFFEARLLENLGPERSLLEVAGRQLVAAGRLVVGQGEIFPIRLESLEPELRFSLPDSRPGAWPGNWQRLLGELISRPNLFSQRLTGLREALLNLSDSGSSPGIEGKLTQLAARMESDFRLVQVTDINRLTARLGLFLERTLADNLAGPRAGLANNENSLKFELLQLLAEVNRQSDDAPPVLRAFSQIRPCRALSGVIFWSASIHSISCLIIPA